ncbi:hypothetical protein Mp_7g02920 [Marchantia polymorpha subsp. ruderalis]|uniref:cyclin-dependent kinase n=2 Tax=Marchantia polymorpha TaxID=3197 RepID=A0AAF6BVK0_MARPO|nr:hypothetical protein MARPO_0251s0001 [Marchantia polymorpha]BBN16034.1 hypothetical protein Mp_7g02920 [Marchantia polymorpha subsp. ruderalis]|eukprot:PTQ26973.1 hypothetical protein MARPO_0251s0001 [Marchantia polymorpha]
MAASRHHNMPLPSARSRMASSSASDQQRDREREKFFGAGGSGRGERDFYGAPGAGGGREREHESAERSERGGDGGRGGDRGGGGGGGLDRGDSRDRERSRSEGFSVRDSSRDALRNPSSRDDPGVRESVRDSAGREKDRDRFRDWDSSTERAREREREREKVRERERDRERDSNHSRQQQLRRGLVSGDSGEGDRVPSPLFGRPPLASSSTGVSSSSQSQVNGPQSKDSINVRESRETEARSSLVSMGRQTGKDGDREPGELPTSGGRAEEDNWGSDFATSQRARSSARSMKNSEPDGGPSRSPPKKRKFSPIVWDYDEKQARPSKVSSVSGAPSTATSMSRFSSVQTTTQISVQQVTTAVRASPVSLPNSNVSPPQPLSGARVSTSPGSTGVYVERTSSPSSSLSAHSPPRDENKDSPMLFESTNEETKTPDTHMQDETMPSPMSDDGPEPGQLLPEHESPKNEDEEDAPVPITIAASRWAEESQTPEREKSPRSGVGRGRKRRSSSVESEEERQSLGQDGAHLNSGPSTSPEPGEYIREKSDIGRVKEKGNESDGSVGPGSGGKDRGSDSVEDGEYERELNKRELMELDDEDFDDDEEEEQVPEVESEFEMPPTPPGPQMRAIDMLQGCRSVDEFERLNRIDEGTYGVVYRARNKKTGEIVALKKVKMEKEKEGFPMTSLREINVLLSIHHPSVVDVKEVVVGSTIDSIFMVMEYMEHDLKGLMEAMKQPFSQSEVKCLMLQLFEGTKYLHDNWVLHRDLKTSNLLLNNRGELKICDFGLARQYGSPLKAYSQMVVTLWYRAPELLLGSKQYSTAIDMWSLGCIMAEFLAKEPLFNGKSEIDQIDKIFKILGTPSEKIWPEFVNLPGVKCNFVRQPYNRLREKFPPTAFAGRPTLSESGYNLLNGLLTYDPKKRLTAEEALKHEWFREVPLPKSKEFMPTFPARSEHDRRLRRLMKSPDPLEEQRKRELRQGELGAGGLFG